jgi:hypothetical protein
MTRDEETYLTDVELVRITKKHYAKAQCRVLAELRPPLPFQPGGDGRPLVLRAVHDAWLGLKPASKRRRPRLEGLSA